MKKLLPFILFIFCNYAFKANAQSVAKDISDLDALIAAPYKKGSGKIITSKNVNRLLAKYQYQIGGSGLKEGRGITHSAVLDEKSLTINVTIQPFHQRMFFLQPKVSLSGGNNFVSIFSSNKFGNIYTGGINFTAFRPASIFVADENAITAVHNSLRFLRTGFHTGYKDSRDEYIDLITKTVRLLDSAHGKDYTVYKYFAQQYVSFDDADPATKTLIKNIEMTKKNILQLVKLKIISQKTVDQEAASIRDSLNIILNSATRIQELMAGNYIAAANEIQINMEATKSIMWLSGNVNYNNQKQPVILNNASTSPDTYLSEYLTVGLAFNMQRIGINRNSVFSPGLSFTNARKFDDKVKHTVNFQSPVVLGGVTGQNIESTINYFSSIPARLNTLNLDLPFICYNPNTNFGFDLALRMGINNVRDDNIGARFGIFVPISKKDDTVVLIEPLIRLSNLFSDGKNDFFKDNFAVGINLSVSLPKLIR